MQVLGYDIENELEFEVFKEKAMQALKDALYSLITKRTSAGLTPAEVANLKLIEEQLKDLQDKKFVAETKQ